MKQKSLFFRSKRSEIFNLWFFGGVVLWTITNYFIEFSITAYYFKLGWKEVSYGVTSKKKEVLLCVRYVKNKWKLPVTQVTSLLTWNIIELKKIRRKGKRKKTDGDDELTLYLTAPVATLKTNVLETWQEMQGSYPNLYKIAMRYFPVVATSVPSERLFSKAGATVTQARNRLHGKRLAKLLFLGSIDAKYWQL